MPAGRAAELKTPRELMQYIEEAKKLGLRDEVIRQNALRAVSSAPVIDLQRLLDAAIFNYLIGNHDAHGKNFSLLYRQERGDVRFAPLYDLVCTIYYPELSKKMAMKIGGEYLLDRISPSHFEKLAEEAGLAKPLVKRRVPELAATVIEILTTIDLNQPNTLKIANIIRDRCKQAISAIKS